jgi:hypothetical protein
MDAVGCQDADENTRMLKSLAPMWEEELGRLRHASRTPSAAGQTLTPPDDEWAALRPPPSQTRAPQGLSDFEGLREQLAGLVGVMGGNAETDDMGGEGTPSFEAEGSQRVSTDGAQSQPVAALLASLSQANVARGGSQAHAVGVEQEAGVAMGMSQGWDGFSQHVKSQGPESNEAEMVDEEKVLTQIASASQQAAKVRSAVLQCTIVTDVLLLMSWHCVVVVM